LIRSGNKPKLSGLGSQRHYVKAWLMGSAFQCSHHHRDEIDFLIYLIWLPLHHKAVRSEGGAINIPVYSHYHVIERQSKLFTQFTSIKRGMHLMRGSVA
jgi:hypothetical protein